jgi:hypothetical protein
MRHMQLFTASIVISSALVSTSSGNSVSHEFTELTGAPQSMAQFPASQTFNFGVAFNHIDSITFSITGIAPPVDWRVCNVDGGCGSTMYTFDDWSVHVYKPGTVGSAVGSFSANGPISIANLPLTDFQNGASWNDLQFGDLKFLLYPVTDLLLVDTAYLQLASSQTATWSDVKVAFDGDLAGWATANYNHDGVVDAADYTLWRDSLGSPADLAPDGTYNHVIDPADYVTWKLHFGETHLSGGAATNIPEPATLPCAVVACLTSPFFLRGCRGIPSSRISTTATR